ncbi:serine/threonine protein kinase [Pendulispora rubella]|uniref:non-specific serine/threonine protein kinase n=1 Tax=Pendulispora rubella TaxID=2741070 RepID=A0ABZ2LHP8_9BACT
MPDFADPEKASRPRQQIRALAQNPCIKRAGRRARRVLWGFHDRNALRDLKMSLGLQRGSLFAGRYRIVRRLGSGAMGSVYEVVHLQTERPCALKIMHAHIVEREEMRDRFKMEAKVAARVGSEYIVDVLDAGVDEPTGIPFFVMERLRGEDLSRRLKRVGRVEPEEALRFLHQVSMALDRTHQASIVHRDLKPANLFLTEGPDGKPRVKVLDFGVAKFISEAGAGATTAIAGTPLYMSPEQCRGGKVTAAADVYAFGMIAYTLLVGEAYFADEFAHTSNLVAFALATVNGPIDPASVRASNRQVQLPKAFDGWFGTVTHVDPERRFASTGEAVRALAIALGLDPLPEARPSMSPPAAASATADVPPDSVGDPTQVAGDEADWMAPTATASIMPSDPAVSAQASQLSAAPHVTDTARPHRPSTTVDVRRKSRWMWIASAAAIAGAAGLTFGLPPAPEAMPAASPLAAQTSVLACPVLEASGVPEPAGWLGAAAAATVCERARVILGGSALRTLVPAELLSLPAQPVDHFPKDPYGQADARTRSLEAARHRAAAYIDGTVTKDPAGFHTTLVLRRPDGSELGHADGKGRALYEAVRQAMAPLVSPDLLPKARELDPTFVEWSRAKDINAALDLLDIGMAIHQNAGSLSDECAKLATPSSGAAEVAASERWRCAYTLGIPSQPVALPPIDAKTASSGALAARALHQHYARLSPDPDVVSRLRADFEREQTPLGRSVLAATLSCLVQGSDPKQASDLAHLAVQADPKNPLGGFCAPWGQLLSVARDTASIDSVIDARQAWLPWQENGWIASAFGGSDPKLATKYARRAYALAPYNAYVTDVLANNLLTQGEREEVRTMALSMGTGSYPVLKVESDLLLVQVDASEARFGAALARARRAMEIRPDDTGWVHVQRFEIAWHALEIGDVLGRAAETADLIVERFLDPDPSPLDDNVTVPLRIPAICMRASQRVSQRCFTRFRALRSHLSGGILPLTDVATEGAERYAHGDLLAAAKAWKPLLRDPGVFARVFSGAMEEALERSGDEELVQRLESVAAESGGNRYNGAAPADVRAARRAAAHGDFERARLLARKVIEAWSVADETVPAVGEMRKLIGRTR